MRIAALGNSHVGSLKRAWDSIRDLYQDINMTFFASPSDSMAGLCVQNRNLAPNKDDKYLLRYFHSTSDGAEYLCPQDFDLFLVYGLYFKLPLVDIRTSAAVMRCTCHDSYHGSLNYYIVNLIRELSNSPIYIGHDPLTTKQREHQQVSLFPYKEIIETTSQEVKIKNLHFVRQPASTIVNEWSTKAEYTINAASLTNKPVMSNDNRHMNTEFGKIYLVDLLMGLS